MRLLTAGWVRWALAGFGEAAGLGNGDEGVEAVQGPLRASAGFGCPSLAPMDSCWECFDEKYEFELFVDKAIGSSSQALWA